MAVFFVDLGFALIAALAAAHAFGYESSEPDPLGSIQLYLAILLAKPLLDGIAKVIDKA